MQASLEMRMPDRLLWREQPVPGDLAIAFHQIGTVLLEQPFAMALVIVRISYHGRLGCS